MTKVLQLLEKFTPINYNLSLTMNRTERTTSGIVSVKGIVEAGDSIIALHAKGLTIESINIDGQSSEWIAGINDEVNIQHPALTPGEHTIDVIFSGKITDAMHGLYPCYFDVNGDKKELLATQFESHHAREVFPCIDEPSAKATYDVTLTTERNVTVLGNMPVANQREEDGALVTTFQTTPRMSSYLLAWVVGDMHAKSASTNRGTEVSVWATYAQRSESLDFALDHAVRSIEFYEEYFGVDYPLPKSDHVALPDFSSGAMENWGLVTYREVALLADPKTTTIESKHYIATVISHELAHMWFGDLVTMTWWNYLWLNESFATLMEYVCVDAIHPKWNIWLDFATRETVMALRRDAIDGVQPVQVDVTHPDEISTLFDGAIVYAKGARLMRMCQNFIGHEAFRAGLQTYFKEFAYGNTTGDDLWRHLSAASGEDITAMMNTWVSTSGYPVVHVTPDALSQEQFFVGPHEPSTKLWPIPLGSNDEKLPRLLSSSTIPATVALSTRLNTEDSAHFITHYSDEHLAALLVGLGELDELGRLQLLDEQTLLARGGAVASANLISLLDAYRDEKSESVWDMMAVAFGELKKFVETDQKAENKLRELAGSLAATHYKRLGWSQIDDESESDTKFRSLILGMMVYNESDNVLARVDEIYAGGIDSIDPEIRSLILGSIVKRSAGSELITSLIELYRTTPSADLRDDICSALTCAKQPEQITLLLNEFTDKDAIKPQDLFRWFAYLIRNRYAREATWKWMVGHWEWIEQTFAGDKSYDDFARYGAMGLVTREQLGDYKDFFTPKRSIPALTRTIDLGVREIEGRIDLLERDGDGVRHKLLNN